jgi:hypothetical protein
MAYKQATKVEYRPPLYKGWLYWSLRGLVHLGQAMALFVGGAVILFLLLLVDTILR